MATGDPPDAGWQAPGWSPAPPPAPPPASAGGASPGQPPGGPPPQWAAPAPGAPPAYGPQYGGWGPPPTAPKPGIVPLRPLGVADILDGAVSYIRRDPRTVLGISAVLSLVLVVLSFVANFAAFRSLADVTTVQQTEDTVLVSGGSIGGNIATVVAALLSVPIGIVATGLLTVVVGQAVLGRRITAGEAWRAARPQFWRLVGLTLLVGLIVGGTGAVGIAVAVLLGILVGQLSAGLGVLLGLLLGAGAVVVAVWLAVRLLLSPAVLLLERCGVLAAIRRSAALVRGSWWRVFGIALLAQLITGLISQVLTVPFALGGTVLAVMFPENGSLWWVALAAISLGSFVASVVTMPFTAGVTALQYVDMRIRREALDIELARAAGP